MRRDGELSGMACDMVTHDHDSHDHMVCTEPWRSTQFCTEARFAGLHRNTVPRVDLHRNTACSRRPDTSTVLEYVSLHVTSSTYTRVLEFEEGHAVLQ